GTTWMERNGRKKKERRARAKDYNFLSAADCAPTAEALFSDTACLDLKIEWNHRFFCL
ncbi:unnamed protein product, partial [Bubo scandiacus]